MATVNNMQMVDSQLLSTLAQQRLRARVAEAPGGIAAVAHEIRTQLAELDGRDVSSEAGGSDTRVSDRAFYVAQLEYLDALARAANAPKQIERPGLLARLRTAFGRAQTAK
jgi:hypothetical protein